MGIFGRRIKDRLKLVAAVGIFSVVMWVILQKYVFSSQPLDNGPLQSRLQQLRKVEYTTNTTNKAWAPARVLKETNVKVLTILMHSFPYYYELQSGREVFSSCDYPCQLTMDADLIEDVDSIVAYSHGFHATFPKQRPPGQIWVFFAVESPVNSRNALFQRPEWRGFFNWTMTYRRESDFYFGYGDVFRVQPPLSPRSDLLEIVAGKRKMAAWFVSNCHSHSRREEFVKTLQEFIQVDVYGQCGTLKCGKEGDKKCMDMLSSDYFFYLALENSVCTDYLTEKVYRTLKAVDVVPVVLGGANYTSLLPPNSFIDASHFSSVQALVLYLRQVASNQQLYLSYLAWKREWRVVEPVPFSFCQFCERLHHKDRWTRVYPDIDAWWAEGQCRDPPAVIRS